MTGGRQREFDEQEALESAMQVFWKKGFAGASLTDLTVSMGINKPSLYATFGNKEQLFIKATEHYIKTIATPHGEYLYDNQVLKVRLKNYMLSVVRAQCSPDRPKGCFVSLCITESEGGIFPPEAAKHVANLREFTERYLIDFFEGEIKLGNLPPTEDAVARGRFITAVLNGTAVMARGGRSIDELEPVIDASLSVIGA